MFKQYKLKLPIRELVILSLIRYTKYSKKDKYNVLQRYTTNVKFCQRESLSNLFIRYVPYLWNNFDFTDGSIYFKEYARYLVYYKYGSFRKAKLLGKVSSQSLKKSNKDFDINRFMYDMGFDPDEYNLDKFKLNINYITHYLRTKQTFVEYSNFLDRLNESKDMYFDVTSKEFNINEIFLRGIHNYSIKDKKFKEIKNLNKYKSNRYYNNCNNLKLPSPTIIREYIKGKLYILEVYRAAIFSKYGSVNKLLQLMNLYNTKDRQFIRNVFNYKVSINMEALTLIENYFDKDELVNINQYIKDIDIYILNEFIPTYNKRELLFN